MIRSASNILDHTGEPMQRQTAPRPELAALMGRATTNRRANLSYDSARSGTDLDGHWAFADGLDADSSNSRAVRHTLIKRSRYEAGSNPFYSGIITTHCNMLVGVGPKLRMLTGSRDFNQMVEREFYAFCQAIQLRRKLWSMAHARVQDGEVFGILQTNPNVRNAVQLDLQLIEAEQCQTPYIPTNEDNYIDGIKFDEFGNVAWYDILQSHPGSTTQFTNSLKAIQVSPSDVLHWFKLRRPGDHRGIPDLQSAMTIGATGRRWTEATAAAAETAADIGAMLTSNLNPAGDSEPDAVAPFTSVEFAKRMLMIAPMGWDAKQMKGEHPNAEFGTFHRFLISSLGRPLSMPYNAASCDSSTYSFASGKLDTLCYRAALDVEREDCNDLVLDRIFAAWFAEWTIVKSRREIPPDHQWDWPAHPVIDAVSEAQAVDMRLKNGSTSLRQVYSDEGADLEDQMMVMAQDWFGNSDEESVNKARQITLLANVSRHAAPYVAQIIGLQSETPSPDGGAPDETDAEALKRDMDSFGVGVRAGALTPQEEDEAEFRNRAGLPAMSPAARAAWQQDKGFRRPITLLQQGQQPSAFPGSGAPPNEE